MTCRLCPSLWVTLDQASVIKALDKCHTVLEVISSFSLSIRKSVNLLNKMHQTITGRQQGQYWKDNPRGNPDLILYNGRRIKRILARIPETRTVRYTPRRRSISPECLDHIFPLWPWYNNISILGGSYFGRIVREKLVYRIRDGWLRGYLRLHSLSPTHP